MKRTYILLLAVVLLLTACGTKVAVKSEEERKAEIRAELEAELEVEADLKSEEENANSEPEILQETVVEEAGNEATKVPLVNQSFEKGISFVGRITCNTAPYFVCLYNEYNTVEVNGKTYDTIALSEDLLSKYVPRSGFSYHLEGFPMIDKDSYFNYSIEFDPTTAEEVMGYLMVKDYRIIEVPYGNGAVLKDYSHEPYPTKYYSDVLYTLCLGLYGAEEVNPMDNKGYEENKDFAEAVDNILSKGYDLVQANGYYKVVNESKVDIDEMPTVKEICNLLSIEMKDIVTQEDGGYATYWSRYKDDEIEFYVAHDDQLKETDIVLGISVTGYDYSLMGVSLGENLAKTYATMDKQYQHFEDRHSGGKAKYLYNIDGYALTLNDIGWYNDYPMDSETLIKSISYYGLLD